MNKSFFKKTDRMLKRFYSEMNLKPYHKPEMKPYINKKWMVIFTKADPGLGFININNNIFRVMRRKHLISGACKVYVTHIKGYVFKTWVKS